MNGRVKYCGKSNNPAKRLKDHCLDFRCMDQGMEDWLKKILAKGLRPTMIIVDEPEVDEWKDMEMFWCEYLRALGFKLFNKRSRNGLTYANSKTFKPGNRPWNFGLKLKEKAKKFGSNQKSPGYYPVPSDITEPLPDCPF
jgi:hypothetical protein